MEKTKNSSEREKRRHSAEFKIEIAERMLAGENVKALSKQYRLARCVPRAGRGGLTDIARSATERAEPAAAAGRKRRREVEAPDRRVGAQGRPASRGERFLKESLQASQRVATSPRAWRECVYTEIRRVTQLEDKLPIGEACALARVARAGYYRAWEEHAPRQAEVQLRDAIQRLMREDNLLVLRKRRYVVTTDSRHTYAVYQNLARKFTPTMANQLWVADITYIRLREQFVYLAVIPNACSRRIMSSVQPRL